MEVKTVRPTFVTLSTPTLKPTTIEGVDDECFIADNRPASSLSANDDGETVIDYEKNLTFS
jgi:hypothetical protein